MRTPFVAGNWKMNGSKESVATLIKGVVDGAASINGVDIAVCPPYVYIPAVEAATAGSNVAVGSQDLNVNDSGAFTGEISANMIKDFGCRYAIVGHSERRTLYAESDELVAEKFAKAKSSGLTPILCIGETLEEREKGVTEEVCARQLDAVTNMLGADAIDGAVIAYEPVWAIGTGMTASPEQAQAVHAFIRAHLAKSNADVASKVQILYGGSVKSANAKELFSQADIDGGLIGGASLDADEFIAICQAAV